MKKLLVLLLNVLAFSVGFPQTGWYWKAPYPQANPINNIFTLPSGKILAIGRYGTVLTSTNSGVNWNVANRICGESFDLRSYFVYNDNLIFIGTENGRVIKSTDGGSNWTVAAALDNSSIVSIDFRNASTGYAQTIQKLYKTTNGGANWVQQYYFQNWIAQDMRFVTPEIGFVCSGGVIGGNAIYDFGILKTTNAGLNWEQVLSFYSGSVKNFVFLNQTTGFVQREDLWYTTNQGNNWSKFGSANFPGSVDSYTAFDMSNSYAGVHGNHFLVTSNGGVNWSERTSPNYNLYAMSFLSHNTGYVLGWNNLIYSTSNAGLNWQQLTERNGDGTANDKLCDHCFVNGSTGFVVGWNGLIKKTTNQGETWNNLNSVSMSHNTSIEFINSLTGFLGSYNAIYKSTDGGNNWIVNDSTNYKQVAGIRFFNQSTGLYGLSNGAIYRTTDAGNSWIRVDSTLYYDFRGFEIINNTTGFAVGNTAYTSGKILKTTNAGLNWTVLASSLFLSNLRFANSLTGYATGTGVIKTTDGGTTWNRVLNTGYYFGVDFPSPNTGFIGGYNNGLPTVVCRTTNGGLTWNGMSCPQGGVIFGVKFFSDTVGIIYGENGAILKTYNGGGNIVSSVIIKSNPVPFKYTLFQNYPNPFNPVTKIKFEIPENGKSKIENGIVSLKIYDLLGKEIETLVNESLMPGTYEAEFDGSSLPSGVYFYSLTSGDFSETKKMVLLK